MYPVFMARANPRSVGVIDRHFTRRNPAKVTWNLADKDYMNLSMIALQGLQQADTQLQSAATKIASFGATSAAGANADTVDLSASVVSLLSGKDQYLANLDTLKVADEIQKSTLDMIA